MSIELAKADVAKLRFHVGSRVECKCQAWEVGTVISLFYVQDDFRSGYCAPYKVKLDNGRSIFAPSDTIDVIRAHMAWTLPKAGTIVISRIRHDVFIEPGDVGAVNGVDGTGQRAEVSFLDVDVDMLPNHFTVTEFRQGHFVCLLVDSSFARSGSFGILKGISRRGPDQLLVNIGQGTPELELTPAEMTAEVPAVFRGSIGSKVYSLIDHDKIRKGEEGTIKAPSNDLKAKDRVLVSFKNGAYAYNLTAEMVTLEQPELPTVDISLISHTHGRERRAERNILREELQAAIKYGAKERANPGRNGDKRWRYTHNGVVYITDETSRHEVTSWRIDGKDAAEAVAPAEVELGGKGCHAVLIVDSSGSMRTPDVPGFRTRAEAVYDCLVRNFVREQVQTGAGKDVVVTLITMSDEARVMIRTKPLNESLIPEIQQIGRRPPKSHGNYLPALDRALEVMTEDAPNRASVLLLFFSDGAPSDQSEMECEHGVPVFQIDRKQDPLMQHRSAGQAWACRGKVQDKLKRLCLDRVKRIGQVFGRDKVILRTLGFGPPREDFRLLEELASTLPRGEFMKLGLDVNNLRTAFSSLSSSMTELRTEGGGRVLTPRRDKVVDKQQKVDLSSQSVCGRDGWWIYSFQDFLGKFDLHSNGEFKKRVLSSGGGGLALLEQPFAEGAERMVYRCTEIEVPKSKEHAWYRDPIDIGQKDLMEALRCGMRLICKEAKDVETLKLGRDFHERFARVQHDAAILAMQFNRRMPTPKPEWNVSYLPTSIYGCYHGIDHWGYPEGKIWVLVEAELEGKFTKWNNNAGAVRGPAAAGASSSLGIGSMGILEEEDEEDEEAAAPIELNEVPQAFSHFSYEHSRGKQLVCDIQGVWNPEDGFVLTDPVVHYVSSRGTKHKNGATDKGLEGVKRFFATHKCGALCANMNLPTRTPDNLIEVTR